MRQKKSLLGPTRSVTASAAASRLKLGKSTALADLVGLNTGLSSGESIETPLRSELAIVKPESRLGAEEAMLGWR